MITKLLLKYMDVLEEINGTITEENGIYYLNYWLKKVGFEDIEELEEILSEYYKKYILTKWKIFDL